MVFLEKEGGRWRFGRGKSCNFGQSRPGAGKIPGFLIEDAVAFGRH